METIASRHGLERIAVQVKHPHRLALAFVLLLHLGATCWFFPPTQALRPEPLHAVDYPVHTHRVYMYREGLRESALPWGYDPAVSAGAVTNPAQDVGAKPQQVLGVLLWGLSPGAVVRFFLFAALLTVPLWTLLACRRLGIPAEHQVWVILVLLTIMWLAPRMLKLWPSGLAGFAAASYFSVFVLALFLDFLARPTARRYVALCLAGSALLLVHILGPVIILPPLLVYASVAHLPWRWKVALWLIPVVVFAVNSFWLIPLLAAQHIPHYAGFPPPRPPESVSHLRFNAWSDVLERLADPLMVIQLLVGVGLTTWGLLILRRTRGPRLALSIGLTCAFGLSLWLFGSFIPFAARTQPIRFMVPAFAFMAIPIGTALATLTERLQRSVVGCAAGLALILGAYGLLASTQRTLPLPEKKDPLGEFVRLNTAQADRLLIQSPDGYRHGGYETKIFPLTLQREVIGCNFPVVYDPPQFLETMLLGRELPAWAPGELREALTRWGVAWAFAVTPEAQALLADALGEVGETVGQYRAFRVPEAPTRFLAGTGRVSAAVNRLELTHLQADGGVVVVRYRYHPGWHAEPPVSIYRFPVPEDPAGFIALKDPPASVTLRFDPWRMLRATWPAPGIPASSETGSFAYNSPALDP